ncbi:MAG TPA: pilus assembly protein TadG-related protein, partial [Dehalococcoidia bacterium]|nr:pilus assembly protein TadG-related protein [Dehalococcoidia bacterium]
MVVLAALSMVLVLAFAALAIDIGLLTHDRRDLQNSADAMALAGASQIRADGTTNDVAESMAEDWGSKNHVTDAEITSITFNDSCSGANVHNSVTVRLSRTDKTVLAGVIGIKSGTVAVCSTAARYSFAGGIGAAPFGVDQKCVYGNDTVPGTNDANEKHAGNTITIKYDSQNDDGASCGPTSGNFWLLGIDSAGAGLPCGSPIPADDEERKLREAICFGAITPLCTDDTLPDEACDTTVDTETGVVQSITDSLNYILQNAPENCDTMAKIITPLTPPTVT